MNHYLARVVPSKIGEAMYGLSAIYQKVDNKITFDQHEIGSF
jgi:hypothetical protein